MDIINKIIAMIPEASPMIIAAVAFTIDMVCRMVKSQKPIGVLYAVSAVVSGLAKLFSKLAALLDKVIPQRLEEPKA